MAKIGHADPVNFDDIIYRFGGNDYIDAGSGHDVIDAGSGYDTIRGGTGWDEMTGGPGRDEFRFSTGDSGPSWDDADIIWDFLSAVDWISFDTIVGSPDTYFERSFQGDGTYSGTYNMALELAKEDIGHYIDGDIFTVFYTDGYDGYLFADTNFNGRVDTGIELRGLTDVSQFEWYDIH